MICARGKAALHPFAQLDVLLLHLHAMVHRLSMFFSQWLRSPVASLAVKVHKWEDTILTMSQTSYGQRCSDNCSDGASLCLDRWQPGWPSLKQGVLGLFHELVRCTRARCWTWSWHAGSHLRTRRLKINPSTCLLAGGQAGLHERGVARAPGVQEPARGHCAALRAGARV